MPVYHKHGFKLTKAQVKKLANGEGVRVSNANLSGSHPIQLTKRQLNKVVKSQRDGVGMVLRMTQPQLKHNVRTGGSIWWDLAKKVGQVVAPVAIDYGADYIKKKVSGSGAKPRRITGGIVKGGKLSLKRTAGGFFGDIIKHTGSFLVDKTGLGMKKKPKKRVAKGIFGDILKGVGGFLVDKTGLGLKKRKRKSGGSFVNAGY